MAAPETQQRPALKRPENERKESKRRRSQKSFSVSIAAAGAVRRCSTSRVLLLTITPYLLLALGRVGSGKRLSLPGLLDLGRLSVVDELGEREREGRQKRDDEKKQKVPRGIHHHRLPSVLAFVCAAWLTFSLRSGACADQRLSRDTIDVPWRRSVTRAAGESFLFRDLCFRLRSSSERFFCFARPPSISQPSLTTLLFLPLSSPTLPVPFKPLELR